MTESNNRIFYIYKITNNINGKTYIGQRMCPKELSSPDDDVKYMGSGTYIKSAKRKYGIKNFIKEIIAVCSSKVEIDMLEVEYIRMYREIGKAEYNIADGGGGAVGVHHSEESIRKQVESLKKALEKPEVRKNYSTAREKWWREVGLTPEQREHFVQGQLGKKQTEEHKRHIGEGVKGTVHSEESKEKVRQKLKGRKLPEEQKRHLSEIKKGIPLPETTKEKLKVIAERKSLLAMMQPYNWKKDILTYWKETPKEKVTSAVVNDGRYHWYHCGTENVRAKECPPGFEPGRYVTYRVSEETKEKHRNWIKSLTPEELAAYKAKLSESHKGAVFTAERCRKISEAKKGKPGRKQSEEVRRKISETLKGRTRTWGARDDREDS